MKLREKAGLTQEQLADLIGVTARTVQNWEAGATTPNLPFSKVLVLTRLFGCSLEELVESVEQNHVDVSAN